MAHHANRTLPKRFSQADFFCYLAAGLCFRYAWVAAGLASSQIVAPRFGSALTWTLGAAAANDFLQAAFSALCAKTNELEQRPS